MPINQAYGITSRHISYDLNQTSLVAICAVTEVVVSIFKDIIVWKERYVKTIIGHKQCL